MSHTFAPATDTDKVPRRSQTCVARESDGRPCSRPVTHHLTVACDEHGVWPVSHCTRHGAITYLGEMKCQPCRDQGAERRVESLEAVRL